LISSKKLVYFTVYNTEVADVYAHVSTISLTPAAISSAAAMLQPHLNGFYRDQRNGAAVQGNRNRLTL
jgi:hypothetical protein